MPQAPFFLLALATLAPLSWAAQAQTIALTAPDATVWGRAQVVRGTLAGAAAGTLFVNGAPQPFAAADGAFAVPVTLARGVNEIRACAGAACSDTLRFTLGYRLRPDVLLTATAEGRDVLLTAQVLDAPGGALTFAWQQDAANPQPLALQVLTDTTARVVVPENAPPGEYYFSVTATDAAGASTRARTFVTVDARGVTPFNLETDHAAWIDRAVLYEITPRFFAGQFNGKLAYITRKIPEFVRLGVNTIWLQPIFPTAEGQQGYDVTDYFGVWDALGTEDDFRALVEAAHAAGLRVVLDFVPNHTSIEHPYAQQAIAEGEKSYYYDFYQREKDDAPYSNNYRVSNVGEMQFVTYFWDNLVNLDYDNPDVQRFMIEATRYWVEKFDIDGFRLDAVWGVVARNPAFVQRWRQALKRVKPDLLLLGETKATDPASFDGRFDAAYDWSADRGYISRWAWQRGSPEATIFNTGLDRFRARDLRNALTNYGDGFAPGALVLRYLENNDTPRFAANHSDAQTRMAAALTFSLPGIPMLFYGQEVGVRYPFPSFPVSTPIAAYDRDGFYAYYQHLIRLRGLFPAFTGGYAEVPVKAGGASGQVFAFRRWKDGQHLLALVNLGEGAAAVDVALPIDTMGFEASRLYVLTDLFTGATEQATGAALAALPLDVPPYTTRLFALGDEAVSIPAAAGAAPPGAPRARLTRNHPNPFSGQTTLAYTLPEPTRVSLRVYDVLGREVARLVEGFEAAGEHTVVFDARGLPGGTYVCRLEAGATRAAQVVTLLR